MPVAPNNNFLSATRLILRKPDTISNLGLSLEPDEPYDGDGKTAWWTFSTPTEGWFVFDATLTADGDITVQQKLTGSVYRIQDSYPTTFNNLDYEDGFYNLDKAVCGIFCHPDSVYYFAMDSIDGYLGEYVARVLPGKLGGLNVTDPEPLSYDFDATTMVYNDGRIYAGASALNFVSNSDTFNTYPIQDNWDQVRGVPPVSYGGASHRSYAGGPFGDYVGYNREGQDIVDSSNYFAVAFTLPFIQMFTFGSVGGDRSTWPPEAVAVQQDGHPRWENITATVTQTGSYEPNGGTIQSDHGSIRADPYHISTSDPRAPFGNMVGPASLTVNLGNSDSSVFKEFQIAPTKATDSTPPAQNTVVPYRQGAFFTYTMNIAADFIAAPFRYILIDDTVGNIDGLQDIERARFW